MEESLLTNHRILGIDFGKKFVGIAISDSFLVIANSHSTIERKRPDKLRSTLASISSICQEENVNKIVVGLPKNLDGSENERCRFTYEFVEALFNRTNIPIYLWDERLTTVSANSELEFMGVKDKKSKSDELAAAFILQGFLDSIKNGVESTPYIK